MYACAGLTTLPTLALPPVCSVIAADQQQSAITTKRAVLKRAASCKNSFWRGVTTFSAPSIPWIRSRDAAEQRQAENSKRELRAALRERDPRPRNQHGTQRIAVGCSISRGSSVLWDAIGQGGSIGGGPYNDAGDTLAVAGPLPAANGPTAGNWPGLGD
jgi:hypothetical protein